MRCRLCLLALSLVALLNELAWCSEPVALLPSECVLTGSQARQRLLVQRMSGTKVVEQVTSGLDLNSSDVKVVNIEDGFVVPVGNGTATITAIVGDQTATAKVVV